MKVIINGHEIEAKQIRFSTIGEPWCEYQLENGVTARMKVVLTKVFETGEKLADGTSIYHFQSTPVFVVDE